MKEREEGKGGRRIDWWQTSIEGVYLTVLFKVGKKVIHIGSLIRKRSILFATSNLHSHSIRLDPFSLASPSLLPRFSFPDRLRVAHPSASSPLSLLLSPCSFYRTVTAQSVQSVS